MMLERIIDLPDNVLGFKATGEVTAEDYQSVLVPAIEDKLSKTKRMRLLYMLGEAFEGYTAGAAWQDAKVGLNHLTQFERVAVVTNVEWIENTVKAFSFVMPGEVRVFQNADLQDARNWISEPPPTGNLTFEFLREQNILILRPQGELEAADFKRICDEIDPQIEKTGKLKGVMIVAEHFPGWDDLSAFAAHFRFVKEHQRKVKRLAFVTNDRLLSAIPNIAKHFLAPETRHFLMANENEALAWVSHGV